MRLEHTFFCILITLVHFLTNNPPEREVGSGLNSRLPEEGQISDQMVRRQRGYKQSSNDLCLLIS